MCKALFRNTIGSLTTMDSGYFWWGVALRRYLSSDVKDQTSRSCVYPSCSMVVLLALPSTADDNPGVHERANRDLLSHMKSQDTSTYHSILSKFPLQKCLTGKFPSSNSTCFCYQILWLYTNQHRLTVLAK